MDNQYELYHHGIKGQKWGVRRFQNKDGSLTPEGRKRLNARNNIIRNRGTTKDVNDIVKSLTKKEKELLGADPKKEWIEKRIRIRYISEQSKNICD